MSGSGDKLPLKGVKGIDSPASSHSSTDGVASSNWTTSPKAAVGGGEPNGSSTHDPAAPASNEWLMVVLVIAACIIIIVVSALAAFYLFKRIRRMRRSRGEYRPQVEENLHAKHLPYINPPNISGLI